MTPIRAAFARLPRLAQANLLLLGGFVLAVVVLLWPEWRHNADLSHGLFLPVVFVLLLHESRIAAPARFLSGASTTLTVSLALFVGLLTLALAGLYAAAVDWSNALVIYLLTAALACGLIAGLASFAHERMRLVSFNWPALAAAGLWLLSAPIPPGTYTRLTLGLQLGITKYVLVALHFFGVPANRTGNIIELASGSVGVEDACSGVRSLLSCVFAGLFFSACFVRRTSSRLILIGLSAPLALGMNFLRSLALTLLANAHIDIAGAWHDVTGFAVLGLTAALLGGLAVLLAKREKASEPAASPVAPPAPTTAPRQQWILASGLLLAAVLVGLFYFNTRPSPRRDAPVPDLLALLPTAASGWSVETADDLYQFRATLQTDTLAQRTYVKHGPDGVSVESQITIYLAYWRANQAPVSLVALHTPDACWPGNGWTMENVPDPRVTLPIGDRTLPETEYRFFRSGNFPQHVWFWHLYDGRPIRYLNPYSTRELFRIALTYGFRHEGDQLFVRVSGTRPWPEIANQPFVQDFFANTKKLGL